MFQFPDWNLPKQRMIQFEKLDANAFMPKRATKGSVGLDLIYHGSDRIIPVNEICLIGVGISIKLNKDEYAKVENRSGNVFFRRYRIEAGIIDNDYTGEIKILVNNFNDEPLKIKRGDKIAQLIIQKYVTGKVEEVKTKVKTTRGTSGFGSTGYNSEEERYTEDHDGTPINQLEAYLKL